MKIRYVAPEFLLVIGILICFLTFIHAGALADRVVNYLDNTGGYRYAAGYATLYEGIRFEREEFDSGVLVQSYIPEDMPKLSLEEMEGTLSKLPYDAVLRVDLQIGNVLDTRYAYIWFSEPKHAGRLQQEFAIENDVAYAGVVYVGQNCDPYLYESGGCTYIDIEGMPFAVAGIYEDNIISDISDRVNILYDTLRPEAKEKISDAIYMQYTRVHETAVFLYSDVLNTDVLDTEDLFHALHMRIFQKIETDHTMMYLAIYARMNIVIMSVIYLFVFGNMVVIGQFWVKVRQRELLIRKIHGASNTDIVWLYAKDFLRLCLVSAILAIPIEYILSHFWNDAIRSLDHILISFGVVMGSFGAVLLLLFLIAVLNYRHISLTRRLYE